MLRETTLSRHLQAQPPEGGICLWTILWNWQPHVGHSYSSSPHPHPAPLYVSPSCLLSCPGSELSLSYEGKVARTPGHTPGDTPEGPWEQTSASRNKILCLLVDQAGWSFGWEREARPTERQERGQVGCPARPNKAEESGVSIPRLLEGQGRDLVGSLVR